MGTSISLRVAGTDIDWAKNGPGENHGPLFQDNDLTRLRSEQLDYDRVDPNDSDLAREEIAFAKQLSGLVPRLELLGFTLKQVEAEYSQTTQEHAEKAEALDEESERSSPRLMTFPEFCAFVSSYPIGRCFRHQVLLRRDRHVYDGSCGRPTRVSKHPHVTQPQDNAV